MAPSARGSARERATCARGRRAAPNKVTRRSTRSGRDVDGLADVYREMLREEEAQEIGSGEERPRKRPKRAGDRVAAKRGDVDEKVRASGDEGGDTSEATQHEKERAREEEESDLEFEDVAFSVDGSAVKEEPIAPVLAAPAGEDEGFSVAARRPPSTPSRKRKKRAPLSAAEKATRLAIHKLHVLCLLYHIFHRNRFCNDLVAQGILRSLLSAKTIQYLNPERAATQAQRHSFFMLGLNQACDLWRARFHITASGLARPRWCDRDEISSLQLPAQTEKPLELADFRRAAGARNGSADLGAQLFCCLLRSVGVEARLVCSLQVLPFSSTAVETAETALPNGRKRVFFPPPPSHPSTHLEHQDPAAEPLGSTPTPPRRLARIGRPRQLSRDRLPILDTSLAPRGLYDASPPVSRPSHPIFWVEVFDASHERWIALDPLATHTVDKPLRLEPSQTDPLNGMAYVVAFSGAGVARDVTRRYTRAFLAKTRKSRVDVLPGGGAWLARALRVFQPPRASQRDEAEEAELRAKEEKEGMPGNIQDFRRHPVYALERHLRANEVVFPRRESGRVNTGTAVKPRFEAVFRRSYVHVVRSAQRWWRLGREIKVGEQPLKYGGPRGRGAVRDEHDHDTEDDGVVGVGLYAAFQTQLYVPPVVSDGKLPRNQYGNIDVYVPSMIPSGAAWIRHPLAKSAAKLLEIEYADAVTGFDFQARKGVARIEGVVVLEECLEGMEVICEGLAAMSEEETRRARTRMCLRLWRKFLRGLREVGRIEGQYGVQLRKEERKKNEEQESMEASGNEADGGFISHRAGDGRGGGGFLPDSPVHNAEGSGGGFLPDSPAHHAEEGGGFLPDSPAESGGGGGGFVTDSVDGRSGAFSPDEYDSDAYVPEQEDEGPSRKAAARLDTSRSRSTALDLETTDSEGAGKVMTTTQTKHPFGFEDLAIPTFFLRDEKAEQVPLLPIVVRGLKRSRGGEDAASKLEQGDAISIKEQDEYTAPPASEAKDFGLQDSNHTTAATAPQNKALPRGESEESGPVDAVMSDAQTDLDIPHKIAKIAAEPTPAETSASVPSPHKLLAQQPAELDAGEARDSDFDGDMPLEDPEDEDAEPEWLQ